MPDATVHDFPDDDLSRIIDRLVREMDVIDVADDPDRMADCLVRLEALVTANTNRMHALGYELRNTRK